MLISKDDFIKYSIDIPITQNSAKLNRAMMEAETIDMALYFNQAFLYDLVKNHTTTINQNLINGLEYNYGTQVRKFEGLKPALCYFAYARLLAFNDITITSNSLVNKGGEYSERISDKQRSGAIATAENNAKFYLSKVKEYIELNSTIYPLHQCSVSKNQKYKVHNNANYNGNSRY